MENEIAGGTIDYDLTKDWVEIKTGWDFGGTCPLEC